jgi:hypothetical protein
MNSAPPTDEPARRGGWLPAAALLGVVTAAALTGPWWFPLAAADGSVRPEVLQRTFHTAWSTMIVLLPAVVMFWRRGFSVRAATEWRVYWTLGYVAYAIHLVWAVGLFFRLDLARMLNSPEFVTLPRLGMVMTVWWGVDVVLAWRSPAEPGWVRAQRIVIHILVVGLFIAGSLVEGSYAVSRVLGALLTAGVLAGIMARQRGIDAGER